jgi:predicted RNase H-like HicB family nuclease
VNRYLIIVEETPSGYSAYSPDVPGCVAAAATRSEVEREMHDAIEVHIEGLCAAGEDVPKPQSEASYCEITI